jgi:hypothetical protein
MKYILLIISLLGVFENSQAQNKTILCIGQDCILNSIATNEIAMTHFHSDSIMIWTKAEKDSIKEIRFYGIDTITLAMEAFENVEKITLNDMYWRNIFLPDVFPNLQQIEVEMMNLAIAKNARFKQKLHYLIVNKGNVKDIQSFEELPNLKTLSLSYGAFEPFPKDLEKLKHLEEFTIGAYKGRLNLGFFDFLNSKSSILKRIVLHTCYQHTISGFPKNVAKMNSNMEFEITHPSLTKEQKQVLKRFKKASN